MGPMRADLSPNPKQQTCFSGLTRLSEVYAIITADTQLTDEILEFVKTGK